MLIFQWTAFVLSQNETVMVQGRAVLLGDHTYAPKDGRRTAGVVTLHQNSETQSKPSYFRGHCRGCIGLLIGSFGTPFCLPLHLSIHQGAVHIGRENKTGKKQSVLGTGIVDMAIDSALKHNVPSVLIPDAFFPGAAVFRLVTSVYSVGIRQPLVTLIIRAKKNCVAYCEPVPTEERKPGRPRKYGMKVRVMEIFDHPQLFSKQECNIYGKTEDISVATFSLLWRPAGSLIRFVFATKSHGPIVLMCSDPNQSPLSAIELYCSRIRIETMSDMLKNVIGAFNYRFWSKVMPRHSRKPLKNKNLKQPALRNIPKVRRCWEAYERFVMFGAICLGILQMTALKYTDSVRGQSDAYLRTRSRVLPSERTVKHVIARLLITNIFILAPNAIIKEIKERFSGKKKQNERGSPPHQQKDDIAA
jgi:hypothetical protein